VLENASFPNLAENGSDVSQVSPNPFVFIVGCPRSGTTLLGRMVDAHPLLAVIHETRWIVRYFEKRIGMTADDMVTPELVPALLGYPQFLELGIGRQWLEQLIGSHGSISYSRFVTSLFDLYGVMQQKSLVGDKCPRYVRGLPLLHRLWPDARFVHLIRDGRDVCLSIVNWRSADRILGHFPTWAADPYSTAAVWWDWHVRLGLESGRAMSMGLYHEARYEALVADPGPACAEICEFLHLPYADVMLRFNEGKVRKEPGLDAKQAWLPPTPGLRDFRTQMQADQLELVEAAAGDLLEKLGYPRAAATLPTAARARARAVREVFAEHVLARGQRVPQGWQS
jgi:hypothetical protein